MKVSGKLESDHYVGIVAKTWLVLKSCHRIGQGKKKGERFALSAHDECGTLDACNMWCDACNVCNAPELMSIVMWSSAIESLFFSKNPST